MTLNLIFSSSRKWTWMEKMPTLCLSFSRKSFHSPPMTPWLSWQIPSLLFGVRSRETMSPGTLRSSWSVLMASPTSDTAEISSPSTLRQILKSYLKMSSKLLNNMFWLVVRLSVMTSVSSQIYRSLTDWVILSGFQLLTFKYHPILRHLWYVQHWGCSAFLLNDDTLWNLILCGVSDKDVKKTDASLVCNSYHILSSMAITE